MLETQWWVRADTAFAVLELSVQSGRYTQINVKLRLYKWKFWGLWRQRPRFGDRRGVPRESDVWAGGQAGTGKREQKTIHSKKNRLRKKHSAGEKGKVTGDEAAELGRGQAMWGLVDHGRILGLLLKAVVEPWAGISWSPSCFERLSLALVWEETRKSNLGHYVCYPDEGLDQGGGGGDRGGQVQEQEKSVCIRAFQGHGTESYILLLFFL